MLALRGVPEADPASPPSIELKLLPWLNRRGLLTELQLSVRPGLLPDTRDPLSVRATLVVLSAWSCRGSTSSSTMLAVTMSPLEMSLLPLSLKALSCEEFSAAMVRFCESFCPLVVGFGKTVGGTELLDGESGEGTGTGDLTGDTGLSPDFFLSWLNNCNVFQKKLFIG